MALPHIAAINFEEKQKAYTDSLDVLIPIQTVSLGGVTFGPEVSVLHHSDGMDVEPRITLKTIWDFDKAELVDLTSSLAAGSTADVRARVESNSPHRRSQIWI